jgi:tRNA nucleotidyltransferase (CCA-adding enzyme)
VTTSPTPIQIPATVVEIARTLEAAGFEAWCVGGSLRDQLLNLPHTDHDIATSARPEQVQALFPHTVAVGIKYGTVGVLDRRRVLHEVTTFRRDVTTDGRHAVVEYGVSLEEDLARRDFTMNAIAYHPLRHDWRDPFDGSADIRARLVRAVGEPARRFEEDYLRILRAVRFAARFDFAIDAATWEAARAASAGLAQLSAERVRDEWFKSLRTAQSLSRLTTLWHEVGAARIWIPELDVAIAVKADHLPLADRDPVLLTALLCHDAPSVLRRLKASTAEVSRAEAIMKGPAGPPSSDDVVVRRWLARVASAGDDLLKIWQLRHGAPPPWEGTVREIRARGDAISRSDLLVSGTDLQALGATGPAIGTILAALLDRVLEDPALNTRDSLLAIAKKLL